MIDIKKLKDIIMSSDNVVFFGGAGVSTGSGIRDFRGKNGLYKQQEENVSYCLSSYCFYNEPSKFFENYRTYMNFLSYKPNIIHKCLSLLEKKGKIKTIITQNIDGLHQKAGSIKVCEIHGTIYNNHCIVCGKRYDSKKIFESKDIPRCKCGGVIKPDVVLFGEPLTSEFQHAKTIIKKVDTLIVAGTSLVVQPACKLVELFVGKNLIIINDTPTPYDVFATMIIHDDLIDVFSRLYSEIVREK